MLRKHGSSRGDEVDVSLIQELLENCTSIKTKRLFLCFAEYLNLPWRKNLDISKIYLGTGYHTIANPGIAEKKYKLILPEYFYRTEIDKDYPIY